MSPKQTCPRCKRCFDYESEGALHIGAVERGLAWSLVKFGIDGGNYFGRVQDIDPSRKSCAVAVLASWGHAYVRQPEDLETLETRDLLTAIEYTEDQLERHQSYDDVSPCPKSCPECRRRKADLKFLKDEAKKAKVRFLKKAKLLKKINNRRRES